MAAPSVAADKLGNMRLVTEASAGLLADFKALGIQNIAASLKANWGGIGGEGSVVNDHAFPIIIARQAPGSDYNAAPIGTLFIELTSDDGAAASANPSTCEYYIKKAGNVWNRLAGSHGIVFAGEATTAGGAAQETFLLTGALSTDIIQVTLRTAGSTPRTITSAGVDADDAFVVTFSGDPSTDHVISYSVMRP